MRDAPSILLRDERLPPRLRDLPKPPDVVHCRGELPRGPAVAIVGTRHPTPEAVAFTRRIAGELARAGVAILSGGAKGIDTAAHRGALAARGVTVVVAPAGYLVPFPAQNAELFSRIVRSGGAYVSTASDSQVATQAAFFGRNACLAALAHVLVVVQCPVRSGARNAAAWARRLGRPLLVVPSSPWIEKGQGCNGELRRGALVCDSARSVLRVLEASGLGTFRPFRRARAKASCGGLEVSAAQGELFESTAGEQPPATVGNVSTPYTEEDLTERVLEAFERGATHPDELSLLFCQPVARINQALLTLRLRGALVPGPPGGFLLVTRRKG